MRTRYAGVVLLCLCAFFAHALYRVVGAGAAHPPTVVEMVLSLLAVVTGSTGAMALIIGDALFAPYVWPPRDDD